MGEDLDILHIYPISFGNLRWSTLLEALVRLLSD